ncbi:hypothetical protein TI04_09735, partial [Achromatium sp. WMS2]
MDNFYHTFVMVLPRVHRHKQHFMPIDSHYNHHRQSSSQLWQQAVALFLMMLTGFTAPSASIAATVVQQAYLKASNAETDDGFGYSIAMDGDTLVVGAYAEDSSASGGQADNTATDAGSAYVFTRDASGTWSQQAYLKASNAGAGDLFGWSVAIAGDTVVVGAPYEDSSATGGQADNSASNAGATYVFTRDASGTW